MRLLEPLSGLKVAQGHLLVHLLFFCIVMSVDDEYCDLPTAKAHVAEDKAEALFEIDYLRRDLTSMNAEGGGEEHHYTSEEYTR